MSEVVATEGGLRPLRGPRAPLLDIARIFQRSMAILGGLGAALAWAAALLCTSRATRMIGSASVLAWVMLAGFCIVVPWMAMRGAS